MTLIDCRISLVCTDHSFLVGKKENTAHLQTMELQCSLSKYLETNSASSCLYWELLREGTQ